MSLQNIPKISIKGFISFNTKSVKKLVILKVKFEGFSDRMSKLRI